MAKVNLKCRTLYSWGCDHNYLVFCNLTKCYHWGGQCWQVWFLTQHLLFPSRGGGTTSFHDLSTQHCPCFPLLTGLSFPWHCSKTRAEKGQEHKASSPTKVFCKYNTVLDRDVKMFLSVTYEVRKSSEHLLQYFFFISFIFINCITWCVFHNPASSGWDIDPVTGVQYQRNAQSVLTWHQARKSCQQQGADLLSIVELHEQSYISGTKSALYQLLTPHTDCQWIIIAF